MKPSKEVNGTADEPMVTANGTNGNEENKDRANGNGNGANNTGDDDEDDDPVVHEIPVFLAKSLANNLYLFQV